VQWVLDDQMHQLVVVEWHASWVQQSKDVIVEVDRWASHARLLGKSKPIG